MVPPWFFRPKNNFSLFLIFRFLSFANYYSFTFFLRIKFFVQFFIIFLCRFSCIFSLKILLIFIVFFYFCQVINFEKITLFKKLRLELRNNPQKSKFCIIKLSTHNVSLFLVLILVQEIRVRNYRKISNFSNPRPSVNFFFLDFFVSPKRWQSLRLVIFYETNMHNFLWWRVCEIDQLNYANKGKQKKSLSRLGCSGEQKTAEPKNLKKHDKKSLEKKL